MPKFSSVYKQVGPTRRILQGENTFEKGMCWTDSMINTGFVHTILNYSVNTLDFTLHVTPGLQTTDLASGSCFEDFEVFGDTTKKVIAVQPRNEYCMRAFEGVTNIISANKISVKNNQILEEQLRRQGYTPDDVICYKLLLYNPINHRLMSVTLLQASRDKYFTLEGTQLRRLTANPISCGFSELWKDPDNPDQDYISNRLNYHTGGVSDYYVPRARRNNYTQTFGQKLHCNLQMQTVPNCDGYGNKTFCFTRRKITEPEGTIKDDSVDTNEDLYIHNMTTGCFKPTSSYMTYNLPNGAGADFVPLEAYRYGSLLTGCVLVPSTIELPTSPITPIDAGVVYAHDLEDLIIPPIDQELAIGIDLNTGDLYPLNKNKINLTFKATPYLSRPGTTPNTSIRPEDIFENPTITDWSGTNSFGLYSPSPINPTKWLKKTVLASLRVGQGIRFAVYGKSFRTTQRITFPQDRYFESPQRHINTLDPALAKRYQDQEVTTVFVLDYVWDGNTWNFSFVDTSAVPKYYPDPLTENWDTNSKDKFGNKIIQHIITKNSLGYTDIVTEHNKDSIAKHVIDDYTIPGGTPTLLAEINYGGQHTYRAPNIGLNLDTGLTIDTLAENSEAIKNATKVYDTSYAHFAVTPKSLTPGEAARWGYNMLSDNPYTFECLNRSGTQNIQIMGMLLKDPKDLRKPLLNPIVNTSGILEIYYSGDFNYFKVVEPNKAFLQLKVEYKNPVDDWRVLKNYSKEDTHKLLTLGLPIQIPFTSPDENVLIRATITDTREENRVKVPIDKYAATGELYKAVEAEEFLVMSQLLTALSYTKNNNRAEISPNIYDLGTATGMVYWKGRLVLWGVLDAESTLFMSEPNAPEYFAYPNDIDLFDENIVHALTYSDALIVFTSTRLWRIDLSPDGLSWTKTLLQQNLRIADEDIPYTLIMKNMLFFKSDTQFYMLVPARGATVGELSIAPISKPIQGFLKDPFKAIREIANLAYPALAGTKYTPPIKGSVEEDGTVIDVPEYPITDYLVKYGAHVEQEKIIVDWWFHLTDWKAQKPHYTSNQVMHDVNPGNVSLHEGYYQLPTYKRNEFWLVQLVYDTQLYCWTLQTSTTPSIGCYVADAVNKNTCYLALAYNELDDRLYGIDVGVHPTWGVSLNYRYTIADKLTNKFNLDEYHKPINYLDSSYPRFQVLDTGNKEVSTPALKKRFREVQLGFSTDETVTEGLKVSISVSIDGNEIIPAVAQKVFKEAVVDSSGYHLIVKIVDNINYEDYSLGDAQLSNTFTLDQAILNHANNIRIRKQANGKGYLVRTKFVNTTHTDYTISQYAFAYHNKNAR